MRWLASVPLGILALSGWALAADENASVTCEATTCLDIEVFVVSAGQPARESNTPGDSHDGDTPGPDRRSGATAPTAQAPASAPAVVAPPGDEWLAAQVRHANRLFAPLDTGFRIATRRVVDGPARIRTRRQRDALGRHPRNPDAISVFVVGALDDVDIDERMLRGVHWRRRSDRSQTWIILSALDDTGAVLAHELGHYFGLPHSRRRRSIMNKSPHEDPAFVDRIFTPPEVDALRDGVETRFPPEATQNESTRPE